MTPTMPLNMRTILGHKEGYHTINREERNLAAIFYHALLLGDNLERFKNLIGCTFPTVVEEVGIYFEYAYIRDLWSTIDSKPGLTTAQLNEVKRKLILDLLQPLNRTALERCSVEAFNTYFGAVPKPSTQYIMSPSRWSMGAFDQEILDRDEFLKVCRLKWCFNAKPDIVIHTTHHTAICIEAKLESGEGSYPSSTEEKAIFRARQCAPEGQLSIQKKAPQRGVGYRNTVCLFGANKRPRDRRLRYAYLERRFWCVGYQYLSSIYPAVGRTHLPVAN